MADAPEVVGTGIVQRVQHFLHRGAQVQVGVANDAGGGPAGTVKAAGAGRALSLHKFHLSHGPQFHGTIGPVHGAGLNEDGGLHVVTGVYVVGQFVEQIALVGDALRRLSQKW